MLIEQLQESRIEIPNYDMFARNITKIFNEFEREKLSELEAVLTQEHKVLLDQLLDSSGEFLSRSLLVDLKNINQSIRPRQIRANVQGFKIVKNLYNELSSVIKGIKLLPEAIRYYGVWIRKATVHQIRSITSLKRYLYLISFIVHQYKTWQDSLVDIVLKSIKSQLNHAEKAYEQELSNSSLEKKIFL